jgi:hypothetical protein
MKPPSVRVIRPVFINSNTRTANKYCVAERDYYLPHTVTAFRCHTLIIVPPGCTILVRVASMTLTALDGHRAKTERTLCASGASLSQLLPSQRSRIARESEWYINEGSTVGLVKLLRTALWMRIAFRNATPASLSHGAARGLTPSHRTIIIWLFHTKCLCD